MILVQVLASNQIINKNQKILVINRIMLWILALIKHKIINKDNKILVILKKMM